MAKKQRSGETIRRKSKRNFSGWIGLAGIILLGVVVYLYSIVSVSDSVSAGARLFRQNCAVCHGAGAAGEDPLRPMGGMKADGGYIAPALNGKGHSWHHSEDLLFDIIKNGSKAEGSTMPGFTGKLTDDEIIEVIRYFETFWSGEIMDLRARRFKKKRNDIFTTGAAALFSEGRVAYDKNCSGCHGAKGIGTDKGPPLVHKIYHPNHHADMSFYLAVEAGVRAHHWRFGNMPKIEGIDKKETGMIIKYVRRLQKESGIF